MSDGVVTTDSTGTIAYFSVGAERIFGYTAAEVVGTPVTRLIPERYRQAHRGHERRFLKEGGTAKHLGQPGQLAGIRKNGEEFPIEATISRTTAENELFATVVIRDVSQREQALARLRLLDSAVEMAVDAVVVTDASPDDPVVEYVNGAFVGLSGYPREELIGHPIRTTYAATMDRASLGHLRAEVLRGGTVVAVAEARAKSGTIHTVELHLAPISDPGGRIRRVMNVVRDVTEQKRTEQKLRHDATHDRLTGLLDRASFHGEIENAITHASTTGDPFAVFHLDIDRFHEINEAFGYEAGDELLRRIGPRIGRLLGAAAVIGHLGGDEYLVLLSEAHDFVAATLAAEEVLRSVREAVEIEGRTVRIDATIGAALYPDHGAAPAELLQHAECAMRAAKRASIAFDLYAVSEDPRSAERLALAHDLRTALAHNQLSLVYQPKVRIATRELVGVEALVRWEHPTRGSIPPAEFVALAEHTGLIGQLTVWVLGEALRQCNRWRRGGLSIPIAVNISMRNLRDPLFLDTVDRLLRSSGAPAELLQLEITEGTIMLEPDRTLEALRRLNGRGIRLVIDDFGTGHSSLAYLDRLPVQEVKIDRSFVADVTTNPGHASIIGAVIELGDLFGVTVVAEGVEDDATIRRLEELGCRIVQGHLTSRAVRASEILSGLADGVWGSPAGGAQQLFPPGGAKGEA